MKHKNFQDKLVIRGEFIALSVNIREKIKN